MGGRVLGSSHQRSSSDRLPSTGGRELRQGVAAHKDIISEV